MGPNLTQLFAQSKHIDRYDGTDDVEICSADAAVHKLRDMFDTHGEALIAALEESLDAMKRVQPQVLGALPKMDIKSAVSSTENLLSQLELEAHNG